MMHKGKLSAIFKGILSLALIVLIFSKIDFAAFWKTINSGHMPLLIVPLVLLIINDAVRTLKWDILCKKMDCPFKYFQLLKFNYVGNFFNAFLPTRFGGDVVRFYYISKETGTSMVKAAVSILFDRISGIIAFLALNLLALALNFKIFPLWISGSVLALDILIIFVLLSLTDPEMLQRVGWLKSLIGRLKLVRTFERASAEISQIKTNPRLLAQAVVYSGLGHLIFIFSNYTYLWALNLKMPFYYFLIFIPVIATITLVPVTVNGTGLREYLVIVLFTLGGLSVEQALALGLLSRVINLINSSIGGIFLAASGLSAKEIERDKESRLQK